MSKTKEFPSEVIASLSSGIMLCKFRDMHEAAEYLMGHSIWTHHFASKDLWRAMQASILRQHPNMPTEVVGVTPENAAEWVAKFHAEYGATVAIEFGNGETAKSPLDGIPQGKPTILIEVAP